MEEVIFEYEINGRIYIEDEPPKEFIDDLLNALRPLFISQETKQINSGSA